MSTKVFKQIQVTGCSDTSYEDAIATAIDKAGETVHNQSWFEVTDLRGAIQEGKPSEWQATLVIGFKVD